MTDGYIKIHFIYVEQAHTSQAQHTPDLVPALWDIINGDSEKGTIDNPIIVPEVVSSMEYEYGKYYLEDTKIYLCKRAGVPNPESMYRTESIPYF